MQKKRTPKTFKDNLMPPKIHLLKLSLYLLLLLSANSTLHAATQPRAFPPGVEDVYITENPKIHTEELQKIAPIIKNSIAKGDYPGAVILAAQNGNIIYRGVFGHKRISPNEAPMSFDTIFDVASLTKVIVTTTSVMQLVEQGKLKLDKPVAKYWPAFGAQGKDKITVRQLLTHTSGLPEGVPTADLKLFLPEYKTNFQLPLPSWLGKAIILHKITEIKPLSEPGTKFRYSDVGFVTLGYLIERVSHEHLNRYAQKHIFRPLGMNDTYFLPPSTLQQRIAPTQVRRGVLSWGEVHDSTAYLMGGVSGMAGLFSDANDLGIFAQALLEGGRCPINIQTRNQKRTYLLKSSSIKQMIRPQTPKKIEDTRGLGWDIDSPYSCRGTVFSEESFGHTGWTGTSMWIDPTTKTWLIVLTSRTHPTPAPKNQVVKDRREIADLVARSVMK